MTKNQLKALQAKWYKKLKESGFQDAEQGETFLKQYHSQYFKAPTHVSSPENFQAKQEYYYRAGHFLIEHKFDSEKEYKIWKAHSEGLSLREIGPKFKLSHESIRKIINKLEKIMLHGNSDTGS